jgi:hypothetical protein
MNSRSLFAVLGNPKDLPTRYRIASAISVIKLNGNIVVISNN